MATRQSNPKETRLDEDVTKPSTTAPGAGPADTTDPSERASTVGGDKKAAAEAGHLTVNAAVPVPEPAEYVAKRDLAGDEGDGDGSPKGGRIEKYEATRPDGSKVTVTHNIDTGETSVS